MEWDGMGRNATRWGMKRKTKNVFLENTEQDKTFYCYTTTKNVYQSSYNTVCISFKQIPTPHGRDMRRCDSTWWPMAIPRKLETTFLAACTAHARHKTKQNRTEHTTTRYNDTITKTHKYTTRAHNKRMNQRNTDA